MSNKLKYFIIINYIALSGTIGLTVNARSVIVDIIFTN